MALINQTHAKIAALSNMTAADKDKVDKLVVEKFDRVFAGYLDGIPSPMSKLVRVFTSSTFTDTTTERNSLMEEVYPALKEYCRETHGLDFQVVDMRWGVRDEATDDHMTTQLCMNEIGNCQRLSMGPSFVAFLCQKYGYRPLPSELLSTELDLLKKTLRDAREDVTLLETWYIEDANAVPSLCILQPISSILVNFNNKRIPKLQEQDAAAWWDTEGKMQKLLRKAARICYEKGRFTHEQMHNYFMSVTEREVINGILKAKHQKEHCVCYVRHINNINMNQLRSASRFVDIAQSQVDVEAQKLLSNLRDERVPSKLDASNIKRFTIEWAGRDGIDVQFHADYLRQFCSDFYKNITQMVDSAMEKHAKYRDRAFTEILQHLFNGQVVSSAFYGRDRELSIAETYMRSSSNLPLVCYGENGCGKTSIIAKIATMLREWLCKDRKCKPVVVLRFLGTSPESSSITQLLISVCDQIAYNYDPELRGQAPAELSKLFSHFKRMTMLATYDQPLVMLFDSLDLLSKVDGAHELLWFPPTLPPNVKLIISTTPGASNIFKTMKRLIEVEEQYVQVPSLGQELALTVVSEWLKTAGRTLSQRQWELVTKALSKSTLPIFVKLVYATVRRWKSYSRAQDTLLSQSVQEAIHALFDRTESQHGKLLVSHALSYITAARSGISDSEVEDLISLDDKVLDDVYQYHLPPVRRIPPLLWSRIRADLPGYLSERAADGVIVLNWYHQQFREAAIERYFKNLNHLQITHSSIADYFLGIWGGVPKPFQYTEMQKQRFGVVENEGLADRKVPKQPNMFHSKDGSEVRYNTRKLNELPYHLLRAGRHEELLSKCLFCFEFLHAKVLSFPLQAVLSDYEDAACLLTDANTKKQLGLVADALRLSASLLSRHPYMLAFELIGRLLPLIADNDRVKMLLLQCDLEGPSRNCFLPGHHCFHSPGGPLKYSLEEHQFAVFGMQLTSDKKMLVSASNQFVVWDVFSGDIARIVNPNIDGIFFGLAVSHDDKFAASYTNNNEMILMSLITGEYQSLRPTGLDDQMMIEGAMFTDRNELLFWTRSEYFVYDLEGKQQVRSAQSQSDALYKALLQVFYVTRDNVRLFHWSGEKEDAKLRLTGYVDGVPFEPFRLCGALVFTDKERNQAYACIEHSSDDFSIVEVKLNQGRWSVANTLVKDLEERINALLLWTTLSPSGKEIRWLAAADLHGFFAWQLDSRQKNPARLRLPDGIRNIPIRPMHSTSPATLAANDTLFVAGVRRNLYLWTIHDSVLVQTVAAHFGRILHLSALEINGHSTLLSSSIDHCIKMWSIENIFEKSFSVQVMDQPVEKIALAQDQGILAVVQTRKYLALWDIRSHRLITTLAANLHGAVVTHSLITKDARRVISVESNWLIVWDLRTQSVQKRVEAPDVNQLFFLKKETLIGTVSRQVDTPEQKTARLTVWSIEQLEPLFTYDFNCRMFREVAVSKGGVLVCAVVLHRGHDSLQVISIDQGGPVHRFRPRVQRKQGKDIVVLRLFAMPHNANQVVVMDSESRGYLWDVKNKKFLRTLSSFSSACTREGKWGLHAPSKGGLEIIDMKTGLAAKTLIPQGAQGVSDVQASFTPSGRHVLYYHNGHKTLKAFKTSDGSQIGCFRPHAQLTCWTTDNAGQVVVIGGQDGSLLTTVLVDETIQETALQDLARLPSRRHLAAHLQLPVPEDTDSGVPDLNNMISVTRAVARFKQLMGKNQKSQACVVQ